MDPSLKGVLVNGEPERDAAWLDTPRGHVGEGEHLPGLHTKSWTAVGEVDVGGGPLRLASRGNNRVEKVGKALLHKKNKYNVCQCGQIRT